MKRIRLLGLGLVAVFALSAFMSTTVLGAIQVLSKAGVESEKVKLSGTSAKIGRLSILKSVLAMECTETTIEAEQVGKTLLGPGHIHWKGCKTNAGGTCTGLGDESGLILALGTAHLVLDKLLSEGTLGLGMLFLIEALHLTCTVAGINKLILVKGELLCLVGPLTLGTVKTLKCEGKEGDPKETVYWKENGEKVELGLSALLASENDSTFEMAAVEGEGSASANEEIELMD